MVITACRAIGSREDLSTNAVKSLVISRINSLPEGPDGIMKMLRLQCTIAEEIASMKRSLSDSSHMKWLLELTDSVLSCVSVSLISVSVLQLALVISNDRLVSLLLLWTKSL